jgi:hypothetical protein
VTDRPVEAWETRAPGPFVTIRAGGPLDGVVTITAIAGANGRSVVEAAWTQDGEAYSESLEAATYDIGGRSRTPRRTSSPSAGGRISRVTDPPGRRAQRVGAPLRRLRFGAAV